jgi:hypothetical protein
MNRTSRRKKERKSKKKESNKSIPDVEHLGAFLDAQAIGQTHFMSQNRTYHSVPSEEKKAH